MQISLFPFKICYLYHSCIYWIEFNFCKCYCVHDDEKSISDDGCGKNVEHRWMTHGRLRNVMSLLVRLDGVTQEQIQAHILNEKGLNLMKWRGSSSTSIFKYCFKILLWILWEFHTLYFGCIHPKSSLQLPGLPYFLTLPTSCPLIKVSNNSMVLIIYFQVWGHPLEGGDLLGATY